MRGLQMKNETPEFIEIGFNVRIKAIEKKFYPTSQDTYKDYEIINSEVKKC